MTNTSTPTRCLLQYSLAAYLLLHCSVSETAQTSDYAEAHVSYLTTSTVYLDRGSEAGLDVGDAVEVMRNGEVIAELTVAYASAHRAACSNTDSAATFEVGDVVRFAAPEEQAVADAAVPVFLTEPETRRRSRRLREMGLSGRIGVRYLSVKSLDDNGADFSQPSFDLRLDGTQIGGSPLGLAVDVRSRRTYRTAADGESVTDGRTQVYRMAVSVNPADSPLKLTAGRQFSSTLASVSIFDGVMGEYLGQHLNAGMFSGTQPDPEDFGVSNEIREHGTYVQVHNKPFAERHWAFTTGLIGSYQEGEVNREFLYLQGRYNHRRLTMYVAQELDFNRDWKEEAGEDTLSNTSTFLNLGLRATKDLSFNAGYDNRRRVRLYRTLVTPVTEFDDSYRQGGWVGIRTRFARRYRMDLTARSAAGGTAGDADSYTLSLGASRIPGLKIDIRTRSTRYTNEQVEGWLHSAGLGRSFGSAVHLELTGGQREEQALSTALEDSLVSWYGAELDVNMGRHWYLSLSGERSEGGTDDNDQIYSSLSYRF